MLFAVTSDITFLMSLQKGIVLFCSLALRVTAIVVLCFRIGTIHHHRSINCSANTHRKLPQMPRTSWMTSIRWYVTSRASESDRFILFCSDNHRTWVAKNIFQFDCYVYSEWAISHCLASSQLRSTLFETLFVTLGVIACWILLVSCVESLRICTWVK